MGCLSNKILEIRDAGTRIDVIATKMEATTELQSYYIHLRAGYSLDGRTVILTRLDDGHGRNDAYDWCGRTMPIAHGYIKKHYAELSDGDVVDVEFILGETKVCKVSERFGSAVQA